MRQVSVDVGGAPALVRIEGGDRPGRVAVTIWLGLRDFRAQVPAADAAAVGRALIAAATPAGAGPAPGGRRKGRAG